MQQYASSLDMQKLYRELKGFEYKKDDSGVLMAFYQSKYIPHLTDYSVTRAAIEEISKLRKKKPLYLMSNIIPPGVKTPVHTDTLKLPAQRWHLAVKTNTLALWWDELDGTQHFRAGFWNGPVSFHLNHSVANLGMEERLHFIVDLEK